VEQIIDGVDRYERGTAWERLDDYVGRLVLDPAGTVNEAEPEDEVTMLTLHSSKGLEFPFVFMIGMNEGGLPHSRALEERGGVDEERRLCYVGMTRARVHLVLTRPRTEFKRGERSSLKPSRFLAEIPEALMQVFASADTVAETPTDHQRLAQEQIARLKELMMKKPGES
jgi:superfamily I DNA/RNA helicase